MATDSRVFFHFIYKPFYFPDRKRLKQFIIQLFKKEGHNVQTINYIFCTDDYLLSINQQYLNHDTYTDIVTFPLHEKGQPISSDIYISIDRVKENAQKFNTSFTRELHRVLFHGALHLCGFKDKSSKQAQQMRNKEEEYLNLYF